MRQTLHPSVATPIAATTKGAATSTLQEHNKKADEEEEAKKKKKVIIYTGEGASKFKTTGFTMEFGDDNDENDPTVDPLIIVKQATPKGYPTPYPPVRQSTPQIAYNQRVQRVPEHDSRFQKPPSLYDLTQAPSSITATGNGTNSTPSSFLFSAMPQFDQPPPQHQRPSSHQWGQPSFDDL